MALSVLEQAIAGHSSAIEQTDLQLDRTVALRDWEATNKMLDPLALAAASGNGPALSLLIGSRTERSGGFYSTPVRSRTQRRKP
jgi:hypothetical protein